MALSGELPGLRATPRRCWMDTGRAHRAGARAEPADVPAADAADLLEDAEEIVSTIAPQALEEARKRERKDERRSGASGPLGWIKRKGSPPPASPGR